MNADIVAIKHALHAGIVIPYLGSGVLALEADNAAVPGSPEALVQRLTAKTSVPHKIRNNLAAAAQFIENFKHRKTIAGLMSEAFATPAQPTGLHRDLAQARVPLIVDVWYDNAMGAALQGHGDWGQIQGLSQSEHFGQWTQAYRADGSPAGSAEVETWRTLLYKPQGGIAPAKNFLVSDTDYVEVLTEIDIQTPIPAVVRQRRRDRHFLFLGCRFANQLERIWARQIMKRSSAKHWAVLPDAPTKNELRFLQEQNIRRIDTSLEDFVAALTQAPERATPAIAVNS